MTLSKHMLALLAAVLSFIVGYLMFKFAKDTDKEGEVVHWKLGIIKKADNEREFNFLIKSQKLFANFFFLLSLVLAMVA